MDSGGYRQRSVVIGKSDQSWSSIRGRLMISAIE